MTRTAEPFGPSVLDEITRQVDERRGGVLSSGMEYPGRYSRWHLAYVNPPSRVRNDGDGCSRGRRHQGTGDCWTGPRGTARRGW